MKHRKFKLAVGVLVALPLLWGVAWLRLSPPEPVYRGIPLRCWLEEFDYGAGTTNYSAAQEAIRAMGTNTLPFLIRYLRTKDPPFHVQWLRLLSRLHLLRKVECRRMPLRSCSAAHPSFSQRGAGAHWLACVLTVVCDRPSGVSDD